MTCFADNTQCSRTSTRCPRTLARPRFRYLPFFRITVLLEKKKREDLGKTTLLENP